jgi:hypothetical protein
MVKVSATEIAEFDMLEMLTNPLIRIQFWRVGRETPQENFLRPTTGEEIFHLIGTTDTPAIPNHQTQLRPHKLSVGLHSAPFFQIRPDRSAPVFDRLLITLSSRGIGRTYQCYDL